MSSHRPHIDIRGLTFGYVNGRRQVPVLDGIDLTANPGKVVAVIGPSGCGKSTMLKIMAGVLSPTSGEILLDGSAVTEVDGPFSYMPQRDCLLPWLSSVANAALLLETRGQAPTGAREQALALIRKLGLEEFAGDPPSALSGGMRQRIALIRTFLPDYPVLLDEPFGALDAITRMQLWTWLADLQDLQQRTMVLVTHDIDEALYLADHIYVMSPRPARIRSTLRLDFPRPRNLSLLGEPDFARLKKQLLETMQTGHSGRQAA